MNINHGNIQKKINNNKINAISCSENKNYKKVISLYYLIKLIEEKNRKHHEDKIYIEQSIKSMILKSNDITTTFDFFTKEMSMNIYTYNHKIIESMIFTKKDGVLYIKKTNSVYAKRIFSELNEHLSNLYDTLHYFAFLNFIGYTLKPLNSKIFIKVCEFRADFWYKEIRIFSYMFNDLHFPYNQIEYNHNIPLNTLTSAIKDRNPYTIINNLFVKINDCPDWSREDLYQIRQNQIEKIQHQQVQEREKIKKRTQKIKNRIRFKS